LPADTEFVIQIKVADLWKSPLLKSFTEDPSVVHSIDEMKKQSGLTPADIESVTLGGEKFADVFASLQSPGSQAPKGVVAVIRTKKEVKLEDLAKADHLKAAEHKSKKYYEAPGNDLGVWAADATTLVVAPVENLKAVIEAGETKTPRKELSFSDTSSHIVVVLAPKDAKSIRTGLDTPLPPSAPAEAAAMQKTLSESLSAVSFGINIGSGIDVQTSVQVADADGAGKVKSGLEAIVKWAKAEFANVKGNLPEPAVVLGDHLVNNAKVESQAQVVTFSTKLPESAQKQMEEIHSMAAPFVGGFNPFGGLGGDAEMSAPKTSRKGTGRKPKAATPGSTTGGGVEVPADPAAGTEEKPEVKKPEEKTEAAPESEPKTEDK
jgi:hypothetical protein